MANSKSKNFNIIFVFGLVVFVVLAFTVLGILSKQNEKKVTEGLPTQEKYENAYKGEVVGFDYENQPSLGDEDAPVKVVVFGDYKCPYCKAWEEIVFPDLYKNYIEPGLVQFYFINYQFLGRDSILAGIAGEAIYHQNKDAFWNFHQLIYEKQGIETDTWATEEFLVKLVKDNIKGIDLEKFEKDLKEHKYIDEVRKDYLIGQKYGVTGTPFIFVNEKAVPNTYEEIEKEIKAALEKEENR